jgi:hypothetical protein
VLLFLLLLPAALLLSLHSPTRPTMPASRSSPPFQPIRSPLPQLNSPRLPSPPPTINQIIELNLIVWVGYFTDRNAGNAIKELQASTCPLPAPARAPAQRSLATAAAAAAAAAACAAARQFCSPVSAGHKQAAQGICALHRIR